jgi:hypothetical protein
MALLRSLLLLVRLRDGLDPYHARLPGASLVHHRHHQTNHRLHPILQPPRMRQPEQSWS